VVYFSSIIPVIKSRRKSWTGRVTCVCDKRYSHRIFLWGNPNERYEVEYVGRDARIILKRVRKLRWVEVD
jgi:hypothetical protein